jgi:hypothetical protein
VPPDYLWDGVLRRRFIYSLTARTGDGKTAVALLLSAHVGLGKPVGDRNVEKGRVLYLAGENPDDIQMRWIAMAHMMSFDANAIDVHFIKGRFSIPQATVNIQAEVAELGGADLVVVDTSAAYFDGVNENDNKEMGDHGRMLRTLTTLPGGPTVLVPCHPVKNASNENLLPRGGGAFLNEMDGNLTGAKHESIVDLHWQGKFRGCDFEPVGFELRTVGAPTLKDSKGRPINTVMATPLTDKLRETLEANTRKDEDRVLVFLLDCHGASLKGMAEQFDWKQSDGKPAKWRVQNACKKLDQGKLAKSERDGWQLTDKGKDEAKRVRQNAAMASAKY